VASPATGSSSSTCSSSRRPARFGFAAHKPGRTSVGVRITKMYFFKGAIRLARFTPRALTPAEFLKVE
jgi:hypothetical protein